MAAIWTVFFEVLKLVAEFLSPLFERVFGSDTKELLQLWQPDPLAAVDIEIFPGNALYSY